MFRFPLRTSYITPEPAVAACEAQLIAAVVGVDFVTSSLWTSVTGQRSVVDASLQSSASISPSTSLSVLLLLPALLAGFGNRAEKSVLFALAAQLKVAPCSRTLPYCSAGAFVPKFVSHPFALKSPVRSPLDDAQVPAGQLK